MAEQGIPLNLLKYLRLDGKKLVKSGDLKHTIFSA